MYDLTIAYRIYPLISKVPAVYPDDKYKMSEICIKSFAEGLKGLRTYIYVILDNCPEEYKSLFLDNLSNHTIEFIEVNGIGNGNTFGLQLDLLVNSKTDYVYFAEDDYFYLENSIVDLIDFSKKHNVDFATAYDHLDYYEHKLHKSEESSFLDFKDKKYYKRKTTTMTFLAKRISLKGNYDIFRTYVDNNWDNSMWLGLTNPDFISIREFLRLTILDMQMLKMYIKFFLHTPSLLFKTRKKYNLYVPHPGTATHLDDKFLSPGVNWKEEFKKYM